MLAQSAGVYDHRKCPKYGSHVAISQHLPSFLFVSFVSLLEQWNTVVKMKRSEPTEHYNIRSSIKSAERQLTFILIEHITNNTF